jgi:hypothetical protein
MSLATQMGPPVCHNHGATSRPPTAEAPLMFCSRSVVVKPVWFDVQSAGVNGLPRQGPSGPIVQQPLDGGLGVSPSSAPIKTGSCGKEWSVVILVESRHPGSRQFPTPGGCTSPAEGPPSLLTSPLNREPVSTSGGRRPERSLVAAPVEDDSHHRSARQLTAKGMAPVAVVHGHVPSVLAVVVSW